MKTKKSKTVFSLEELLQLKRDVYISGHTRKSLEKRYKMSRPILNIVLDKYNIDICRSDAYINYGSLRFMQYCNFLQLNSHEIMKLVNKTRYRPTKDEVKNFKLSVSCPEISLREVFHYPKRKARPPRQFINPWYLTPAIAGGFSLRELMKITQYNERIIKTQLEACGTVNLLEQLRENNKLILPEKNFHKLYNLSEGGCL